MVGSRTPIIGENLGQKTQLLLYSKEVSFGQPVAAAHNHRRTKYLQLNTNKRSISYI